MQPTSTPSSVYGPVTSWRFGRSLGIDPIVQTSTCSFNCVYCQLGAIQNVTDQRGEFVSLEQLRRDLESVDWAQVDVVTFSGSGEPTLATNLGAMVELIRSLTSCPIHLLSNSTQFYLPQVRREVSGFDVIACKLDAPDEATLHRINRPAPGVTLERIVEGIMALKAEFPGRLTLQIMFMPMNVKEVLDWVPLIKRIGPAEIQLNTPRRPYPLHWYRESRGDHSAVNPSVERRTLKVITPEEARWVESVLREQTGVPMISVYREEA